MRVWNVPTEIHDNSASSQHGRRKKSQAIFSFDTSVLNKTKYSLVYHRHIILCEWFLRELDFSAIYFFCCITVMLNIVKNCCFYEINNYNCNVELRMIIHI